MPLYEVMLMVEGDAEVRLTDHPLVVGDSVEIARKLWRVANTITATREDAELRYVLVPTDPSAAA